MKAWSVRARVLADAVVVVEVVVAIVVVSGWVGEGLRMVGECGGVRSCCTGAGSSSRVRSGVAVLVRLARWPAGLSESVLVVSVEAVGDGVASASDAGD